MVQELAQAFHISASVLSTVLIAAMLIAALVIGFILNRILHHWTKKLKNGWGELVFSLLESLPLPLLLLAALYIGLELLELPRRYERIASELVFAFLILILFYFPAKVAILFLRRMGQRQPHMTQVAQPATFLIRALFAVLAIIIILENLGISLTAVWTTLGVGSVAVALALQETLSNLFAGLYILADRPISPGDYIKLDGGQEGAVVRIGWRSTVLRSLPNNYVVVPNSVLAKATITNYSTPEPRMAYVLSVSVAYGTDPNRVEGTLLDVAQQAIGDRLEGLLAEPAPAVRFIPGFGQSSLDFSLIVHLRQFTDQFPVQSELRKRILKRFEQEGIQIPFPTQVFQLDEKTRAMVTGSTPQM